MSWIQSDFQYTAPEPYVPPTWADGTDEEIVEALEKHYAEEIDLTEYWSVGDEREVNMNSWYYSHSMDSSGSSAYAGAQTISLVLMNAGGKTLVTPINGISECAFVVGFKNCVTYLSLDHFIIHPYSPYQGGWEGCAMREMCNQTDETNHTFYKAFPATIIEIFKLFYNYNSVSAESNTIDRFALFSEVEIFGTSYRGNENSNDSIQMDWYKTSTNRIKTYNGSTADPIDRWWERYSSYTGSSSSGQQYWTIVNEYGNYDYDALTYSHGFSPFGVI